MSEINLPSNATANPTASTSQRDQRHSEALVGWLMAAPAIVLILTFLIVPFLMAFGFSFTNQRLISPNPTEFVGLSNFSDLLRVNTITLDPVIDEETGDPVLDDDGNFTYPRLRSFTRDEEAYPQYSGMREWFSVGLGESRLFVLASDVVFMKALFNTLLFVVIVAPTQAFFALLLALTVNQHLVGVNIFRTIYFMPVVVSLVVVSLLWRFIYDGQNGLLNTLLGYITFGAFEPIDWLGNPRLALGAIIVMSVWQGVGFHMVIWLSGLQTIPFSLYEAASIDGANGWQRFWNVTWPGLQNTAILILIVITIQSFALFAQVDVMTRGGPVDATQTLVFQAVERGFERQNIAGGSAISVIFFLLVLTVSLVQQYLTREQEA